MALKIPWKFVTIFLVDFNGIKFEKKNINFEASPFKEDTGRKENH